MVGDGELFMWAELGPFGTTTLQPCSPRVGTASTFREVRDFLPMALHRRVEGSTWHRIQTDPAFRMVAVFYEDQPLQSRCSLKW